MSRHLTDAGAAGGDQIGSAAEMASASAYATGHFGASPPVGRQWPLSNFAIKDASGNFGLGIASPVSRLNVQSAGSSGNVVALTLNNPHGYGTGLGTGATGIRFARSPTTGGSTGIQAEIFGGNENETTATGGFLSFRVRNGAPEVTNEAMRVTSNGDFCIGLTATLATARLSILSASNGMTLRCGNGLVGAYMSNTSGTAAWQPFSFCNNGATLSQIGSISCTTTATSYNTSSDYRLKDDIEDLTGSGEFIDALRPRKGIWKADRSLFVGFIAHEFAEVSPSSVTGQKDETRPRSIFNEVTGEEEEIEEPAYQSMQASSPEVMAHVILELQSLRARLATAEAKIAELEGA